MPGELPTSQPQFPAQVPLYNPACPEMDRRIDKIENDQKHASAEFRTLCGKVDILITKLDTAREYDMARCAEHKGRTDGHENWIRTADNRLTKLEGFTASAKWIIGSLIACTGTLVARVVSDWVQFGLGH